MQHQKNRAFTSGTRLYCIVHMCLERMKGVYFAIVDLKKSGNNSMTLGPGGRKGENQLTIQERFSIRNPPSRKRSWRHIHIWPLFQIAQIHPNPGRENHSLNRGLLVIFLRRTGMGFGSEKVIHLSCLRYTPADPSSHQYHRLLHPESQSPSSRYHANSADFAGFE